MAWSFRLILVAASLSSVSLEFMTPNHLVVISCTVCSFGGSGMVLSHLRTHIRWAASESRIWRRRPVPRVLVCGSVFPPVAGSLGGPTEGRVIVPHPRMMPRLISGHGVSACGQRSFARDQMILVGGAWQCKRICSMDSVVRHILQNSRCALSPLFCQCLPTFWVPCMAL